MYEFVKRAAPFFGDIGGKFDPIQAEVCAVQQSQFFTDQQHIAEEDLDFTLHRRDKLSNGAVIGSIAIGEGNEENIFLAGPLNLSGTDHALGVAEQNDFE